MIKEYILLVPYHLQIPGYKYIFIFLFQKYYLPQAWADKIHSYQGHWDQ